MTNFQNPTPTVGTGTPSNGPGQVSDARRLSARILLVLACLMFFHATCCGMAGVLGATLSKAAPGAKALLAIVMGGLCLLALGLGGGLIVLRKQILNFNHTAAVIAAVVAGFGIALSLLAVLGNVGALIMKADVSTFISLGISFLWLAAFGQLMMYLVQVLKEPR